MIKAKIRDVVVLQLGPRGNAVVVSVDEESQVHGLDRTAPSLVARMHWSAAPDSVRSEGCKTVGSAFNGSKYWTSAWRTGQAHNRAACLRSPLALIMVTAGRGRGRRAWPR